MIVLSLFLKDHFMSVTKQIQEYLWVRKNHLLKGGQAESLYFANHILISFGSADVAEIRELFSRDRSCLQQFRVTILV